MTFPGSTSASTRGPRARRLTTLLLLPLLAGAGLAATPAPARAATACPAPGGAQPADEPGSPTADVVVHGHGFGHGMGMSQYGAQGAALLGCSAGTILRTYYPGLNPQPRPLAGRVLVDLLSRGGDLGRAEVRADGGAVTWTSGSRSAVQPAGSTWRVQRSGSGVVVLSGTSSTSPRVVALDTPAGTELRAEHRGVVTRTSTWSSSGSANLVRRSDGDYTRFTGGSQGLSVREVMEDDDRGTAVSKYLTGLAEMPVSWPLAAQAAQVVAARTYLLGRYVAGEGGYVVLPTTANQVWQGSDKEQEDARYGGTLARAVAQTSSGTSGTVMVTSTGAVARDLLYASSHGGWSESNTYVWGSAAVPHLRQVDDSRWDAASSNPYRTWTVSLSYAQVADAFGFDSVSSMTVAPRGSAQRTGVVVQGVRSGSPTTVTYTGQQARDRLARISSTVRSSGFTFSYPHVAQGRPLAGDWDGDGLDESGWWYDGTFVLRARDGSTRSVTFGPATGTPVVGDWDGDGRDSIGVVDGRSWWLGDAASTGALAQRTSMGRPTDLPVVGDWDGDGRDSIGVVRGKVWYLRSEIGGGTVTQLVYGRVGDRPVVGDWDGDGVDEPGVQRGTTWYLPATATATGRTFAMGRSGDLPVSGSWVRQGADTPGLGRAGTVFVAATADRSDVRRWVVIG